MHATCDSSNTSCLCKASSATQVAALQQCNVWRAKSLLMCRSSCINSAAGAILGASSNFQPLHMTASLNNNALLLPAGPQPLEKAEFNLPPLHLAAGLALMLCCWLQVRLPEGQRPQPLHLAATLLSCLQEWLQEGQSLERVTLYLAACFAPFWPCTNVSLLHVGAAAGSPHRDPSLCSCK